MTPPKKRSPGRPEGSPNVKADQSEVVLSRCAKCGSTEREPYFGTPFEVPFAGEKDGKPYTHVVKKRTKWLKQIKHLLTSAINLFLEIKNG